MPRLLLTFVAGWFLLPGVVGAQDAGVVGDRVLVFSASVQDGAPPARDGQQPARPGTATLRGRVYAADTGQALRRAQVRIITNGPPAVAGQPPDNRLTTTDANGRYEFKELRAGRYTLNAQKGSFVGLSWGQQRPNEPGKPLDILDGQTVERVDFALPRGAVITGRIFDEFGEPISDVQVSAMRFQNINGTRRLMNNGRISTTNDIGEFRIFALAPGDYYVSATLRNFNNPGLAQDDNRSGYAPTYYPGTPDAGAAQKITLTAGQTANDITIPLLAIQTSRVSGTAVDSQGRPMRGVVQAMPKSDVFGGPIGFSPGQVRPDGSFTIAGLAPGDYTLNVFQQGGPGGPPGADQEFASLDIAVGGSDITGVRLAAAKPSTIAGKIIVGAGDPASLKPSTIRVGAQPMPTGGINFGPFPPPAVLNDDWTFQTKARAGIVRVQPQGLQAPWSVKAVRHRGSDVTDTGIEVKSNEDLADVEIELTNRTTDLSGLVTSTRGEPVKDYWAVLFSRDHDKWKPPSRYVRLSRPDQEGRFKVGGLPPGDYFAFAGNTIDPTEATSPEFLERAERAATKFSLNEGETKTLDLKLATVP